MAGVGALAVTKYTSAHVQFIHSIHDSSTNDSLSPMTLLPLRLASLFPLRICHNPSLSCAGAMTQFIVLFEQTPCDLALDLSVKYEDRLVVSFTLPPQEFQNLWIGFSLVNKFIKLLILNDWYNINRGRTKKEIYV